MSKDKTEVPHARRKTAPVDRSGKGRLNDPRNHAGADGRSLRSAPASFSDLLFFADGSRFASTAGRLDFLPADLPRIRAAYAALGKILKGLP